MACVMQPCPSSLLSSGASASAQVLFLLEIQSCLEHVCPYTPKVLLHLTETQLPKSLLLFLVPLAPLKQEWTVAILLDLF